MKLMNMVRFLPTIFTAGTTGFDIESVMIESVNSVQGQLFTVLGIVVPAIVLVVGAVVGVKFGIKWLKSLGKG